MKPPTNIRCLITFVCALLFVQLIHIDFVLGTTCFGLDSTNAKVCSGYGKCTATNVCTCNAGYYGTYCNKQNSLISRKLVLGKEGVYGHFYEGLLASGSSYPITDCDGDDYIYFINEARAMKLNMKNGIASYVRMGTPFEGMAMTYIQCSLRKGKKFCFAHGYRPTAIYFFDAYGSTAYNIPFTSAGYFDYDQFNDCLYYYDTTKVYKQTNLDHFNGTAWSFYMNIPSSHYGLRVTPTGDILASYYDSLIMLNKDGTTTTIASKFATTGWYIFISQHDVYIVDKTYIMKYDGKNIYKVITHGIPQTEYYSVGSSRENNTLYLGYKGAFSKLVYGINCVDTNWGGDNCDQVALYCNSVAFNDPKVCSGHGTCQPGGTCSCSFGYTGVNCSSPVLLLSCFGVSESNGGVCSGRGKCTANNTCICDSGYYGSNCHIGSCYNITANSSKVCSGHGYCRGNDSCVCYDGYAGTTCNNTVILGDTAFRVSDFNFPFPSGKFVTNETHLIYHDQTTYAIVAVSFQNRAVSTLGYFLQSATVSDIQYYNGIVYFIDSLKVLRYISGGITRRITKSIVGQTYFKKSSQTYGTFTYEIQTFQVCSQGIIFAEAITGKIFKLVFDYKTGAKEFIHIAGKGYVESGNSYSFSNGNGDPLDATLGNIKSLLINDNGDLFMMDTNNFIIRQFNLLGTTPIATTAGVAMNKGYSGDALSAKSSYLSITADSNLLNYNGALMFFDVGNNLIRKISNGILYNVAGKQTSGGAATIGLDNTKTTLSLTNLLKTSQGDIVFLDVSGKYMALNISVKCSEGFTGSKCDEPLKCGGRSFLDPNVCSKRGACLSTGVCDCPYGWTGSSCEYAICYNVDGNDANVCGGKGTCVDIDVCQCNAGYSGSKCSEYSCFGVLSNSTAGCSSHGICVSPNNCQCALNLDNGFWYGPQCDTCKPPFTGTGCNTIPQTDKCQDDLTCFGHGKCNSKGSCVCSGNFAGTNCNGCKTGYYGYDCDVYCDPKITCSGNGYCNSILGGVCTCNNNLTSGYYYGTDCSKCQPGYYGTKCSTQILGPPVISNLGNSMTLTITGVYFNQNIPCSRILTTPADESTSIGTNPQCYWKNKESGEFYIEFGDAYDITPGESTILFRTDMLDDIQSTQPIYQTMKIGKPLNPIIPIAKIQKKKTEYGACEDLTLDGLGSFSGDRKPLIFHWGLVSSTNSEAFASFNATLSLTSEGSFILPTASFPIGTHVISLIVESTLFHSLSVADTIQIIKSSKAYPVVYFENNYRLHQKNWPFFASVSIYYPPCVPNNTDISFSWNITESDAPSPLTLYTNHQGRSIAILNFPDGGYYTYKLTVQGTIESDPTLKFGDTYTIKLLPRELGLKAKITSISYNDATVGISYEDPDDVPEKAEWKYSCLTGSGLSCGNAVDTMLSNLIGPQSSLSFSRTMFNQTFFNNTNFNTKFYISTQYSKGIRVSKSQAIVQFSNSANLIPPLITNIYKPTSKVSPGDIISVLHQVTVGGVKQDCNFEYNSKGMKVYNMNWYVDGQKVAVCENVRITAEEGKTYNFEFRFTQRNIEYVDITTVVVNRSPACTCIVTPTTGVALDTIFTMTCPNCQNQEQTWEISYGYFSVTLKKGVNSFQTAFPVLAGANSPIFIKITDTATGISTTKTITIHLNNPFAENLSELSSLIALWKNKRDALPVGDSRRGVFDSFNIARAVREILFVMDPAAQLTRSLGYSSRRLRTLVCNGHGQLINGTCSCNPGYYTSDCKYSTADYEAIRMMKQNLFDDFLQVQLERNSTFTPVSDEILYTSISGINSFLADLSYLKNSTFESCVDLFTSLWDEAEADSQLTISQLVAESAVSTLESIYQSSKSSHKQLIDLYFAKISRIRLRTTVIGEKLLFSNITFTDSFSMRELSLVLENATIAYSDSLPNLSVKFSDSISTLYDQQMFIFYSFGVINNLSGIDQMIRNNSVSSEYTDTVISQSAVFLKIYNQKSDLNLNGTDAPIVYQIPLSEKLQNNTKSRQRKLVPSTEYSYSCVPLDEYGEQIDTNVTCSISFIVGNDQLVKCICSGPTTVIVVKSSRIISVDDGLIYCNGTVSSDSNSCSGNGNCTDNEVCQCKDGFNGIYCQFEIPINNSTNSTSMDNSTIDSNSTMDSNSTYSNNITDLNNNTIYSNSSDINNTTVQSNTTIVNSTVDNNSTIEQNSTIGNNATINSTVINDTLNNSTFNSTVNNTILEVNTTLNSTQFENNTLANNSLAENNTQSSNNSLNFNNHTSQNSSSSQTPILEMDLIVSKTVAEFCDQITLKAIVRNNSYPINFLWRSSESNSYLKELLDATSSDSISIENRLLGSGSYNISVSISEGVQQVTQTKTITVRNVQPILSMDETHTISIGSDVDVAPSISLPNCYPYSNLVYSYSMNDKEESVTSIEKLVFDDNGILSIGATDTVLAKAGTYYLIFSIEGPSMEPIKKPITLQAVLDTLVIGFNVSSEISLVTGSSFNFQISTNDPNKVVGTETLEIQCSKGGETCNDISLPITQTYSTILQEGVYNFTAIITKGSRSAFSTIIVTVQSPSIPNNAFASTLSLSNTEDLNFVDPNTDLKVSFRTSEKLNNPKYTWTSDIPLSGISSSYLIIPKSNLVTGVQHNITLDIKDGIRYSKTTIYFTVNSPPTIGKFAINPQEGIVLETVFTLDAQEGWLDSNLPLTYRFFYLDEYSSTWVPLSERTESSALSISLPPGFGNYSTLRTKVHVFDSMGVYSYKESSVIVRKPKIISDSMILTLNAINSSIASESVLSTALNVISAVSEKTDKVIEITNNLVSNYVENVNMNNINSEKALSTISVYSYSANCLPFLQDSVTSNLISKLESFSEIISASTFDSLDEQYLDSIKLTADKFYDKVVNQTRRSLSTKELITLIENVYVNLARAYVKSNLPDMKGKLISSNSISTYSRKINTASAKSSLITSEIVDSYNTILSLTSNIAQKVSSLSSFTIVIKSQSSSVNKIISKVLTFSVPEVPNGIVSNSPIGSLLIKHTTVSSNNISCVCYNSISNSFEKDVSCCRLTVLSSRSISSTSSIYLYRTAVFALRDENDGSTIIPEDSIVPPTPTISHVQGSGSGGNHIVKPPKQIITNSNNLFGLLSLLSTLFVVVALTVAVIVLCVRRRKYMALQNANTVDRSII